MTDRDDIATRLEACPFCSSDKFLRVKRYLCDDESGEEPFYWGFHVICDGSGFDHLPHGCGASSGWAETEAEAAESWNRRDTTALRAVEKERDEARRNLATEVLSHEMTAKRLDEALPLAERLPLETERKEYWKGRYERTQAALEVLASPPSELRTGELPRAASVTIQDGVVMAAYNNDADALRAFDLISEAPVLAQKAQDNG